MLRSMQLSLVLAIVSAASAPGQSKRYLDDFEFIRDAVTKHYAALESKDIEWKRACEEIRPAFADCDNDRDHVVNCLRLLAQLRDSHSGLLKTTVDSAKLPSKWDGLYGGGLWLQWDRGLIILRGIMEGHRLAEKLPRGSVLVEIDGWPAWLAMERERRRILDHRGSSSDHSLFASMGNRFLPFGEKRVLPATFVTPEGKSMRVEVPRWGPRGKAFSMFAGTVPQLSLIHI